MSNEPNAKRQRTCRRVFSGGKRFHAWEQMKEDNADDLFTKTICNENDVRNATHGLWNPDKPNGIRSRSLLYVLAANGEGVPQHGAVQCLTRLLALYPHVYTTSELREAYDATVARHRKQCARVIARKLLQGVVLSDGEALTNTQATPLNTSKIMPAIRQPVLPTRQAKIPRKTPNNCPSYARPPVFK